MVHGTAYVRYGLRHTEVYGCIHIQYSKIIILANGNIRNIEDRNTLKVMAEVLSLNHALHCADTMPCADGQTELWTEHENYETEQLQARLPVWTNRTARQTLMHVFGCVSVPLHDWPLGAACAPYQPWTEDTGPPPADRI